LLQRGATFICQNELWLLGVYAVPLALASNLPLNLFLASLATVPAFWLARRVSTGAWTVATPLDPALLLWLLVAVVGTVLSPLPLISVRTTAELTAEISLYYGLVNGLANTRRPGDMLRRAAFLLVALGTAMGLVGLLDLDWRNKFLPESLFELVPRVDFSFLQARGFNQNIVAGVVAPLIPISIALAGVGTRRVRASLGVCTLILIFIVMATQSRGALLGLVVGLVGLVIWRGSKVKWLLAAGLITLSMIALWWGLDQVGELLLSSDTTGSAAGRFELWSRALLMLQDFPFTGIGPGTFERVVHLLYPLFLNDPTKPAPHVHNLYLQMGVDYGLPGLVAFVGVTAAVTLIGLHTVRRFEGCPDGTLAKGLFAAYLVYLAHGLLDAVTFSTKAAIIVWAIMALLVALYRRSRAIVKA
jgi:O-Antigen ligase